MLNSSSLLYKKQNACVVFFTASVSKTHYVQLWKVQALSYILYVRYSFFEVHCCRLKKVGKKKPFSSPPDAGDRAENTMESYLFLYTNQTNKTLRNNPLKPPSNFTRFLETKYFRSFNRSDSLCQDLNMFLSWSWQDMSKWNIDYKKEVLACIVSGKCKVSLSLFETNQKNTTPVYSLAKILC